MSSAWAQSARVPHISLIAAIEARLKHQGPSIHTCATGLAWSQLSTSRKQTTFALKQRPHPLAIQLFTTSARFGASLTKACSPDSNGRQHDKPPQPQPTSMQDQAKTALARA